MRRGVTLFCCGIVLFAGACGGSSNNKSNASDTSATTASTTGTTKSSGSAGAFADACLARNSASAPSPTGADFAQIEAKLRLAVEKSPVEIRADMKTMVDPLIRVYDVYINAKGDYSKLAANGEAQVALQGLNDPAFKAAQARVQAWWAAHCG